MRFVPGERRAQAEVIGAIFLIITASAALALFAALSSAQYYASQQQAQAQSIAANKAREQLSVSLTQGNNGNPSTVTVANGWSQTSMVVAYIGINNGGHQTINLPQPIAIAPGGTATFQVSPSFTSVGVVTSLGNVFYQYQTPGNGNGGNGNGNNACPKVSLTVTVSPSGSGTTTPSGTNSYCQGQSVTLVAYQYQGYSFSSWTGSISSTANPVTVQVNSNMTVTANFVPYLTLAIYPQADGFEYNTAITRYATVVVYGPTQAVSLSASNVPSGVSVSFSPSSVTASPSGAVSTMTVSYTATSYNSNLTFTVTATSQYGTSVQKQYTLSQTPPNWYYQVSNSPGTPVQYKTAFWDGIYYVYVNGFYVSNPNYVYYSYLSLEYYSGGWHQSGPYPSGCSAYEPSGQYVDIYQYGNQIFFAAASASQNPVTTQNPWVFDVGTLANGRIDWLYTLVDWSGSGSTKISCGSGVEISATYQPYGHISIVLDSNSYVWVALDEYNNGYYYIEVMKNSLQAVYQSQTATGFDTVYISPQFSYDPIPQLFALKNGDVALVYQFTNSQCSPDYMIYTNNHGMSWSSPIQLTTQSGYLCWAYSGGTSIGDTIYFGGKTINNVLSFWSFNLDTMVSFSPSGAIDTSISAAAITSVNNAIAFAYIKSDQLYVAWSYDNSNWLINTAPGTQSWVTLPSRINTFQLLIAGSLYPYGYLQISFFTI